MSDPPTPEGARLAALRSYGILDTPPEEAFENLARIASHICEAPVALVSLVDEDRQWFKAKIGVDVGETPRETAFCSRTVRLREMLVVPDTRADAEFASNPAVVGGPKFRFYAAAPLLTPDGHALGTVCVLDTKPRALSAAQLDALKAVAAQAMAQLELRRAEQRARDSERQLHSLWDSTFEGILLHEKGRVLRANASAARLLGYEAAEMQGLDVLELVPPARHAAVRERLAAPRDDPSEMEILRKDGSTIVLEVMARDFPYDGRPVRMVSLRDHSARHAAEAALRESEERFRRLAEAASEGIAVTQDGRIVDANAAFCRITGFAPHEVIGQSAAAFVADESRQVVTDNMRAGFQEPYDFVGRRKDGATFPGRAVGKTIQYKGRPGRVTSIRDLTIEKRSEDLLRRHARRLDEIVRAQQTITAEGLDLDRVLRAGVEQALRLLDADGAAVELVEGDELVYRAGAGAAEPHVGLRLQIASSLSGRSIREGRSLRCDDAEVDPRVDQAACRRVGVRSMVVAPLRQRDATVGVLKVTSRHARRFDEDATAVLEIVAGALASAASNAAAYEEREQALARVRESEASYRRLVDESPDAILVHREGVIAYANSNLVRLLKAEGPSQLVGRTELEFVHPSFRDTVAERVHATTRGGSAPRMELTMLTVGGEGVEVEAVGTPTRFEGLPAVQVIFRDIRARKRAEREREEAMEAVRLSEARLAEAQRIVRLGNWDWDVARDHVTWSRELPALLGFAPGELAEGQMGPLLDRVHPEDRLRVHAAIENAIATSEPYAIKLRLMLPTGETRHLMAHGQPQSDETGRVVRVGGTIQDVTESERAADALREARQAAERAGRAKAEFLANMSHEIRTPMNAVIGMASLLGTTTLDEEQREYVDTIHASGEHLLTVIDDILNLSKIESGSLELAHEPFDVRDVLDDALELVGLRAAEKDLELLQRVDPGVPRRVEGDASRLRQVLVNLLSNAVKFTDRGEIVASVSARPGVGDRVEMQVSVRDTGIGIKPEHAERLFRPFAQGDMSATRAQGGTGLGLAISRRLVELMGGRIWLDSTPGKGSTFHFTFSAPPLDAPAPRDALLPTLQGKRVLVVEGSPTARKAYADHLSSWGMAPHTVATMEAALAAARARPDLDAFLLGHGVFGIDAAQLAAEMRRIRGDDVPLVLLAPNGWRKADLATRAGGNVTVLAKPLRASHLQDALLRAFGAPAAPRQPRLEGAPRAPLAEGRPLRVLVVEDVAVNQIVAVRLLQRLGHEADVAGNGHEALRAAESGRYDVILMDVQMPEMDGLEATRRIRARMGEATPRIVALTAHALEGERQRCLDAGMDDYLSKPVQPERLARALRVAEEPGEALDAGVLEALQADLGGQREVVSEIVGAYLRQSRDFVAAIDRAEAARDAAGLRNAAHALKSGSLLLGARQLGETCKRIEAAAKQPEPDWAALARERQRLRRQHEAARRALEGWRGEGGTAGDG